MQDLITPELINSVGHGGTITLLFFIFNELKDQRKRLSRLEETHAVIEKHAEAIDGLKRGFRKLKRSVTRGERDV